MFPYKGCSMYVIVSEVEKRAMQLIFIIVFSFFAA